LAFIAALQHLPGRQRAVLILRDVLSFRADETAGILGTTPAAVNSALQRARTQLAKIAVAGQEVTEPGEARQRELVDLCVKAFENADIGTLLRALTENIVLEMPPIPTWFRGRHAVGRFLAHRLGEPGSRHLVPTAANGQPAFGIYVRGHGGVHRAHALQVLTIANRGIARIDLFHNPGLFASFDLPVMQRV
jgi:RNA polymerase sigma-70 factor (ECF subfamily)